MKIAYLVTWDLSCDDALTRKIRDQVEAWRGFGATVEVFGISPSPADGGLMPDAHAFVRKDSKNPVLKYINSRPPFREMRRAVEAFAPDLIYIRAQPYKPDLIALMKSFPAVVEINSPDLVEGRLHAREHGWYQWALHHYNRCTRGRFYGAAAGFVSVTREMLADPSYRIFDKPSVAIPNGIPIRSEMFLPATEGEGRKPGLVLIGTGGYQSEKIHWQGVDKVIDLAWKTRGKLEFHLIGNDLIVESKVPDNVTVHGWLQPEDTREVFGRCDVGIGTMALHRKDMDEACPLKVRDYAAAGLALVVGYEETAFAEGGVPDWALALPNTEGNLAAHVEDVVRFSESWKGRRVAPAEAAAVFGLEGTERRRLDFFDHVVA